MKAFLLAAGYGTRLKPLTDTTPKCLIPIHGKPLMEWWFDLFVKHGITEVLVNTHYLAKQVEDFVADYQREHAEILIKTVYEPELLGSGGTIYNNLDFVNKESSFFICYADNLTDLDLTAMMQYHHAHSGSLTMALFHAPHPEQCGIATVNADGKIINFIEKPEQPESNLANAGIYIASREVISMLSDQKPLDFGFDVLPKLAGSMNGYPTDCFLMDTGTFENYQKAEKEWLYDYL